MPSLRFLLFVALLAALVLAVPAPSPKGGLQKRSFKVPRQLNTAYTARPDGVAAMRKVFLKYNLKGKEKYMIKDDGFISVSKEATGMNSTTPVTMAKGNTGQRGSVAANPGKAAALFLSPVTIGNQTFNMDFDTGSADLWTKSILLGSQITARSKAFDPKKSSTFRQVQGAQWKISYGDGSGAAGVVGLDTVTIGGVTVQNQAVELASKISQSFADGTQGDGLVGLAFPNINTVTKDGEKTPQNTFFANVMKSLDMPVFSADLNPDGSGAYEFGKIDSNKFEGKMAWIPVKAETGFWQFPSTKFAVGNQAYSNEQASDAIADTGTSLLLVDAPVAKKYYQQIAGVQMDPESGLYTYPCKTQLPSISVAMGDSYMAKIPGSQLTFQAIDDANTACIGAVQSNGDAGVQIYGDILFRAQYVVFNGGNNSLGIAPKRAQ